MKCRHCGEPIEQKCGEWLHCKTQRFDCHNMTAAEPVDWWRVNGGKEEEFLCTLIGMADSSHLPYWQQAVAELLLVLYRERNGGPK